MRCAVIGLVVVVLSGCVDPQPSTPAAADLEAIDLSPDHTVAVDDRGFDPAELEVRAGDVIRLVNEGTDEHTFTADGQRFDTGIMEPGDHTTVVLTEPGEVAYRDLEEPDHTGVVTVRARP